MSGERTEVASEPRVSVLSAAALPYWVDRLLPAALEQWEASTDLDISLSIRSRDDHLLIAASVPKALELGAPAYQHGVEICYDAIAEILRKRQRFPVRIWNYVPGISRRFDNEFVGYELFNAGRSNAYSRWFGGEQYANDLPAASAVDTAGQDFVVQMLAGKQPGIPIDNPRQIPPPDYSAHYSPQSPAFARGTLLEPIQIDNDLSFDSIVSGTASIEGEESQHPGDVLAQLQETSLNLAAVSQSAQHHLLSKGHGGSVDGDNAIALSKYRALRVYVTEKKNEPTVIEWFSRLFPHLNELELVRAELCRPDLLVEAEGIAFVRP